MIQHPSASEHDGLIRCESTRFCPAIFFRRRLRDGSTSTSTKAPSLQPTATSRRPPSRTTTRWVGRASRTSLARTRPSIGSSGATRRRGERAAVAGRVEPRRDRLEPARLDLDRLVAQDRREVRTLARETVEDRDARASRSPRRIRAARTGRAGRAGPTRRRRPARARPRRSGAPRVRSGSRPRGRGGPPRPGSSRRRGRTARGP